MVGAADALLVAAVEVAVTWPNSELVINQLHHAVVQRLLANARLA